VAVFVAVAVVAATVWGTMDRSERAGLPLDAEGPADAREPELAAKGLALGNPASSPIDAGSLERSGTVDARVSEALDRP